MLTESQLLALMAGLESDRVERTESVYGSGVERAQEALKTNANPPASFVFEDTYFLVTMKARP